MLQVNGNLSPAELSTQDEAALQRSDCILMYHGTPERDAARLARQLRAIAFFFDVVPLDRRAATIDPFLTSVSVTVWLSGLKVETRSR